jgi:hypothetical protein
MKLLELIHPLTDFPLHRERPGFDYKYQVLAPKKIISPTLPPLGPIVYQSTKFSHQGLIGFKTFENCNKKMHRNSIVNLLSSKVTGHSTLDELIKMYLTACSELDRRIANETAIKSLDQEGFDMYLQKTHQSRKLNAAQSRKIRSCSEKLCYYSATRKFKSKKSGNYNMKIAFLTLTAPAGSEPVAILKAFNHFLDYLARTANCVYVWKKELGEKSHNLHFHVIVNNFVPYYIVSWKWKRVLLAEGISFDKKDESDDTNAHTRIELPRSKKEVAHYISKYLSKAYELPGQYGYISGHSSVLSSLKETTLMEGEYPEDEIRELMKVTKVIRQTHVTIVCCDLLKLKDKFPKLYKIFEKQYLEFSSIITLPQKFQYV